MRWRQDTDNLSLDTTRRHKDCSENAIALDRRHGAHARRERTDWAGRGGAFIICLRCSGCRSLCCCTGPAFRVRRFIEVAGFVYSPPVRSRCPSHWATVYAATHHEWGGAYPSSRRDAGAKILGRTWRAGRGKKLSLSLVEQSFRWLFSACHLPRTPPSRGTGWLSLLYVKHSGGVFASAARGIGP
ncbi:hypothetical protein L226DRAFT_77552 [Lentinus tigrinus ALCF2SS1-7]|uniref:uncharacterized protein n=1 Tax=Lentinus tigrinus ALCF2SS1-7 TaxID=1328758 RepID=UPI0011662C5A|nr:hypothetical protein L226DRAFT_77552 [Lentinus tigrinus ALCF2SS1-7]